MTDQEEQRMIEQAKAGDPKAKYEMSLWARQMSALEPADERWNRLAAKCLVEAAQAGYEPAKKMVQTLILEQDSAAEGRAVPAPAPAPAPEPEPDEEDEESVEEDEEGYVIPGFRGSGAAVEHAPVYTPVYEEPRLPEEPEYDEPEERAEPPQRSGFLGVLQKIGAVLLSVGAAIGAFFGKLFGSAKGKLAERKAASGRRPARAGQPAAGGKRPTAPARPSGKHSSAEQGGLVAWLNANWSVVRIVCIAVCVVMAILIVWLLIPAKNAVPEPTPTPLPTAEPTPVPTPEPFPNAATRTEIAATAVLDYRPEETEYLIASAALTVSSDVGLNMRSGPSTEYEIVNHLDNGAKVTAYALSNEWYLINSGGSWGWVSGEYLQ